MKKYIICFLVMCIVFSGAYYVSYHYSNAQLEEEKLAKSEESFVQETENVDVVASRQKIKPSTKLVMEDYNLNSEEVKTETSKMPAVFLGLDREALTEYLEEYMQNISLNEMDDGLISYEVIKYSQDSVTLRKTYYVPQDFNKYYLLLNQGKITVYYSDKKTVFEYTDIKLHDLPRETQIEIISGKPIKDDNELFDFLETYSS